MKQRRSGILLHPSSLCGDFGIGTLGKEAKEFIDWLQEAKQTIWQILPLGPTGDNNSPYQCFSAFAGNPLLIDLHELVSLQLIETDDLPPQSTPSKSCVDFTQVIERTAPVLAKAFETFEKNKGFDTEEYTYFWNEHWWWLQDYSLYMACRENEKSARWNEWDTALKNREESALNQAYHRNKKQVWYHRFIQYTFYRQWFELKKYANNKGIKIFGDIPLYVSYDSSDVWANQQLFLLDEKGEPTEVGGVPPDYFSETGQLWGNPVFDWDALAQQDYQWWLARIHTNLHMFDWVRIDHFRGLESFWSVPASEETAINGIWRTAHGDALFSRLRDQIGELPIVAEDLGTITEEVHALRVRYGLPGMKVLQFGFLDNATNEHLPHNYEKNFAVYTGTHDNDTLQGWLDEAEGKERRNIYKYISLGELPRWQMIRLALGSIANTCLLPMQDVLGLAGEARMNIPGTIDENWKWKMTESQLDSKLAKRISDLTIQYNRTTIEE